MLLSKTLRPSLLLLPLTLGCSDGGATAPPAQSPDPLDAQIAECLRINACDAQDGEPVGLQACLQYTLDERWSWGTVGPEKLDLQAMACKLAAKDCAAVRACTPPKSSFFAICAANAGSDVCDGDTWVFCDPLGAPVTAMNCSAAGLSCKKDVWAGCGAETCEFGTTKRACDPEDPDVLIECDASGFLRRIDCRTQSTMVHVNSPSGEKVYAIAGETCGFDQQRNDIACIGKGESCPFFSQACEGAVLATCAGGKMSRHDCSKLDPEGQSCGFIQSGQLAGAASCGFIGEACDMGADEACEGDVVSFCHYDKKATVDCKAEGFSGCATAKRGESTIAYCVP